MKKSTKIILKIFSSLLLSVIVLFFLYVNDFYKADPEVYQLLAQENIIQEEGYIVLESETNIGILFYPGGKVEAIAYLPLLNQLQEKGYHIILIEMPFNLAIFDKNAAEDYFDQFPDINHWYIAGHSLGGAMASAYASEHPEKVEGLILLGAYLYGDYPASDALTIYGTFNSNLEENINYTENIIIIEGGNHAQFGNYGPQKGDPEATISSDLQQSITVEAIDTFIQSRL